MRQLLTAVLVLISLNLGAQSKEVASLVKNYNKMQTDLTDAKKSVNPNTWVKYGKLMLEAYDLPIKSLFVGMSNMEAKILLKDQKPVSSEYKDIQKEEYEVVTYDDKILYYAPDGKLSFWTVSKPVFEFDMLSEAYKAFTKAYELDAKGSQKKTINENLQAISNRFLNDAMAAYSLNDFATSSQWFESSIKCVEHPAVNKLDTTVVYYAGLTAHAAKDYARSKAFFERCIDMGFTQNGDAYANLAECYKFTGDMETCKAILAEGFTKHPDSQSILVALINMYLDSNDDPAKVLEFIHKAQENEPNNASLYYAEGNVQKKLGNLEEAIGCYRKSVEIDPKYVFGYFSAGVAYYDNAVAIQTRASDELDDNKYMVLVEELDKNLELAIEPFEKCFEVVEDPDIKAVVVEYLKNIYFRLRTKNPDYEAAYNKYNDLFSNK